MKDFVLIGIPVDESNHGQDYSPGMVVGQGMDSIIEATQHTQLKQSDAAFVKEQKAVDDAYSQTRMKGLMNINKLMDTVHARAKKLAVGNPIDESLTTMSIQPVFTPVEEVPDEHPIRSGDFPPPIITGGN